MLFAPILFLACLQTCALPQIGPLASFLPTSQTTRSGLATAKFSTTTAAKVGSSTKTVSSATPSFKPVALMAVSSTISTTKSTTSSSTTSSTSSLSTTTTTTRTSTTQTSSTTTTSTVTSTTRTTTTTTRFTTTASSSRSLSSSTRPISTSTTKITTTKTSTTATSITTSPIQEISPRYFYGGGPVLSSVEITIVFYNSTTLDQSDLVDYYNFLSTSQQMNLLKEYNTPSQTITKGKLVGTYRETKNLKSSLDDLSHVRPYFRDLVLKGTINPTPNSYYALHLGKGITVSMGGGSSCITFGGYHNAIYIADIYPNTTYLYYGLIPYCGTKAMDMAPAISHELVEAITDPLPPQGWYSQTFGEIADICSGIYSQLLDDAGKQWWVQRLWSNKEAKCIASAPDIPATTATTPSASVLTSTKTDKTPAKTMNYYGQPLVTNIEIKPILLGPSVQFQSNISSMYSFLSTQFVDLLAEYSTPNYRISRGTTLPPRIDASMTRALISDEIDIKNYLRKLVQNKLLTPAQNSFYPIHLAPGITVTINGYATCSSYCAYSGAIDISDLSDTPILFYAVIPDPKPSCLCQTSPDPFRNVVAAASAQIAATITNGQGWGWYNQYVGDVTNACDGLYAPMTDSNRIVWTIQKVWSNVLQMCISSPAPYQYIRATSAATTKQTSETTSTTLSSTLESTVKLTTSSTTTATTTTTITTRTTTALAAPKVFNFGALLPKSTTSTASAAVNLLSGKYMVIGGVLPSPYAPENATASERAPDSISQVSATAISNQSRNGSIAAAAAAVSMKTVSSNSFGNVAVSKLFLILLLILQL
ncbi:hypothetical protein CcCBS67573_g00619 [Chytriomyces confervae]|uniref:Uncharacterized protein n=1 Tax=Chytriomyces confervae TaxID=246404 RepID=A0A507FPC8_9FUNG|nr:hypothetical protein HDU80_001574 [Chytriomyces hyalinus]TPX78132.1 hypothetical protein CcCBS67573_g00619 [Chytriomyces confervae]